MAEDLNKLVAACNIVTGNEQDFITQPTGESGKIAVDLFKDLTKNLDKDSLAGKALSGLMDTSTITGQRVTNILKALENGEPLARLWI